MNSKIQQHYKNLFKEHGNSPKSVQWSDELTQKNRFEILSQISGEINSVIDLGCGLAHYFEFVKEQGFKGKYLGLDFVSEFVEANRDSFKDCRNAEFEVFDIMRDIIPSGYDYIVISGMFNNKIEQNEALIFDVVEKCFKACQKGVAFNALSKYVDYFDEGLYYSDPLRVFDFCKRNLTRSVTLRHEYILKPGSIPYEYTVYLYK